MVEEIKHRIVSQLCWLEECTQLYVKLIMNPEGVGFPDCLHPKTINECVRQTVQISKIEQILSKHKKDNIWRSRELFSDELCTESVGYVPLFLDIDINDDRNDLEIVYRLTIKCLDQIEKNNQFIKPGCLRVIFSGHKGFHIEAIPDQPVDNLKFRRWIIDEMNIAEKRLDCHDNRFKDGTIDSTTKHEFIRVTGSYNSWRNKNGIIRRRKVTQYSLEQYKKTNVEDIIAKSEET